MTSPIITLLTDFGSQDPYVGVMKGVILGLHPAARIVDLTHEVGAQNIRGANFALRGSYSHFPAGTIHVVVVDPGVGSQRRILAVKSEGQVFLAPDNGVLTGVALRGEVREITNRAWFKAGPISRTFHGRDIFAPVAARLARGEPFEELGNAVGDPQLLEQPEPVRRADGVLLGKIIHVDSFGNLITNIRESLLASIASRVASVEMNSYLLEPPKDSYASVKQGQPLTIVDSFDFLEIAVRGGSAARHFNASVGDEVRVRFA